MMSVVVIVVVAVSAACPRPALLCEENAYCPADLECNQGVARSIAQGICSGGTIVQITNEANGVPRYVTLFAAIKRFIPSRGVAPLLLFRSSKGHEIGADSTACSGSDTGKPY